MLSRVRQIEVHVLDGPDRGKVFPLSGERFTVGRQAPHDIVLTDTSVSADHLELRLLPGGVRLLDRASTNGTWSGRIRLTDCVLADGAKFHVGDTRLQLRCAGPTEVAASTESRFCDLVGRSESMRILFAYLERLAPTPLSVLVLGESGTGKELVARAIHQTSRRAGPLVTLDCTTLPRELAESLILGHKKGSFTGAATDRKGCFEEADGGTLFIDEIGELPTELQPKLLRVLERREVCRVGEVAPRRVDVRIVAATHRDLRAMVSAGDFRLDLFQRLAQAEVFVAPLRERPEDVEALAMLFVRNVAEITGVRYALDRTAIEELMRRHWEGNVRELKNAVERAAYLSADPQLTAADFVPAHRRERRDPRDVGKTDETASALMGLPLKEAGERLLDGFRRRYCGELLERYDGDIDAAAAEAGYGRRGFVEMLRRLGMREP